MLLDSYTRWNKTIACNLYIMFILVGAMCSSDCSLNRRIIQCNSLISVVLQCKLVSCQGLQKLGLLLSSSLLVEYSTSTGSSEMSRVLNSPFLYWVYTCIIIIIIII